MGRQREQRQDRRGDGDHDRPQTLNSRVEQCLLERRAMLAPLFDEVEQHDDVADDDSDERDNSKKSHEPERRAHQPQRGKRARHAVRDGGEDQQRLHGVLELNHERYIDQQNRDRQNRGEFREATDLLLVLTCDLHPEPGASVRLNSSKSPEAALRTSEGSRPGCRKAGDRHGAELVEAAEPGRLEALLDCRPPA